MAAGMRGELLEKGCTGQLGDSGAAYDKRPQVGGRKRAVYGPSSYGTESGDIGGISQQVYSEVGELLACTQPREGTPPLCARTGLQVCGDTYMKERGPGCSP